MPTGPIDLPRRIAALVFAGAVALTSHVARGSELGFPWFAPGDWSSAAPASVIANSISTPAAIAGHPTDAQLMWYCGGVPVCASGRSGTLEAAFRREFQITVAPGAMPDNVILAVAADDFLVLEVNETRLGYFVPLSLTPGGAPHSQFYWLDDNRQANGQPRPLFADITQFLVHPEQVEPAIAHNVIDIYGCDAMPPPAPDLFPCLFTAPRGEHFVFVEGSITDLVTGEVISLSSGPEWQARGRLDSMPVPEPPGLALTGVLLAAIGFVAMQRRVLS